MSRKNARSHPSWTFISLYYLRVRGIASIVTERRVNFCGELFVGHFVTGLNTKGFGE